MHNSNPEAYQGWEEYPQNISLRLLQTDVARSHRRLSERSKELFVANDDSKFARMKDGYRDVNIKQVTTTEHLHDIFAVPQASSVFFINQKNSWSRFCISEEHFRRLFTRLRVHPSFLDIVHSFDIGYNIKYVAKHGRAFPKDPFSIREVGVYQHFSGPDQQSNWVLLQASDQLKDRLRRIFQSDENVPPAKQFLLHSMILLDVSEEWREYLIYLEDRFSDIVDKGFYTNVTGPQLEGDIVADFSDTRRLHILTDKLRRLIQILKQNIRIGKHMKVGVTRIGKASSPALQFSFDELQAKVDRFLLVQETSLGRLETLIERSSGIGQLVQSIQDIRAAEAGKKINHEMRRLTEQGVDENKLMKKLAEQTTKDTRSMMAIALISAIFLPATFLAKTLFGSNFFVFSENKNALTVASNFWVYIVIAIVFSGVTVTLWFVWRRRKLRQPITDDV
ncbi:hypothetical protein DM02DRAFT_654672 [Periconia macrospinosa]|uniref:CorA-like transporter domain-containing protein n=1 Tax=Periconia macrospinosa TaxID=97972 RepID=A0A2V1DSL0_9PLEO|nr:hypothetical protein DM02DRAFT_654672 [Periconia macrospinosa]